MGYAQKPRRPVIMPRCVCCLERVPLAAQTYFCDSRSPLRFPLRDLPLSLHSRAPDFFAGSAPAPEFQAANWKCAPIFTQRICVH